MKSDLTNGNINFGSKMTDILTVLQGEWLDTERNGWNLVKLSNKFCIAKRQVVEGENYILPLETTQPLTPVLFIGEDHTTSSLIKLKQAAVKAPLSGIAIIFF